MAPARTQRSSRLARLVARLERHHGKPAPPPMRDPYRLLLFEHVAYLADDATRLAAWKLLEDEVGTEPHAIRNASRAVLGRITRAGGAIAAAKRAERLQDVAVRVLDRWDGDLSPVLRLPFEEARRELARFPSIGLPGAERILLLCGAQPVLALDSNGLRVLLRLGYGVADENYARELRSAQQAAERELPATIPARRNAHLLLRLHGQTLCRRTRPRCFECPLSDDCPAAAHVPSSP
jgi:endonuclease III